MLERKTASTEIKDNNMLDAQGWIVNINDERKKVLAGEMRRAIGNLANIVMDWNDAKKEPDERGRVHGAIGLVIFEDGSGYFADFHQDPNHDALVNGSVVHRFSNPEEAQDWFSDNISGRSLI